MVVGVHPENSLHDFQHFYEIQIFVLVLMDSTVSWVAGETLCSSDTNGGHLVWINNAAENDFITSLLNE